MGPTYSLVSMPFVPSECQPDTAPFFAIWTKNESVFTLTLDFLCILNPNPKELVDRLGTAAINAKIDEIVDIISLMRLYDEATAETLLGLSMRFDYQKIIEFAAASRRIA